MEERLIGANRLKEVLERNFLYTEGASVLVRLIDSAPTVESVKHGRWVQKYHDKSIYYCSECNFPDNQWYVIRSNYCGHCGAKMEGEVNERK